ncbi:hypothetical protein [Cupriavidus oxalaticus]|uniref:hypothetical protein n=1 Tax=Cupriavidus oxalaticus TaxID=96344 RepID=UPI003172DE91
MTNRFSAQINAEIYNIGPAMFNAVRNAVIQQGTTARTAADHASNKAKLSATVASILAEAAPRDLDHRALWQVIWPRITYAGTRASKATAEIASMRACVPLFGDLNHYVPGQYVFDKQEWLAFVHYWKGRQATSYGKQRWLERSKTQPDWNPAAHFKRTTPQVWQILTKDDNAYPGLMFSALPAKAEKYFTVAGFLHEHRAKGALQPLEYYTGGHVFHSGHLTGEPWVQERSMLETAKGRFEQQLGQLTALHTMMDLGLKTIKPDRVMTYLFSRLGWLQTLPATMSKQQVVAAYLDPSVIREMTARADVLAASLDKAGFEQAHRLLDIWFVKYGQEPERSFGITVNLQNVGPGIRGVLEGLKGKARFVDGDIGIEEAAAMWPMEEFASLA